MMAEMVHFIGIGGIGMSALARILLARGVKVFGSDAVDSATVDSLRNLGAKITIGHSSSSVPTGATVVYSTAIGDDNPEYRVAIANKNSMMHRSDMLQSIMCGYKVLAVTGTHGKTTTSALLTHVLICAGLKPSYAVGGVLLNYNSNSDVGDGEYFVAEADESDGSFTKYSPYGAIITNIGKGDHLDHYGCQSALDGGFKMFASVVTGDDMIFFCGDDRRLSNLMTRGVTYGFGDHCTIQCGSYSQDGWNSNFDVKDSEALYHNVELALVGKHNALNALAVIGMAQRLGVDEEIIRHAFKTFKGVARRCEKKGDVGNILILDDYAHHPIEIGATLEAIRNAEGDGRRLVVVYQPHRYTRTEECMLLFGTAFERANLLVITDIYSAGEIPIPGITAQAVVKQVRNTTPIPTRYIARDVLVEALRTYVCDGDVVVTVGAGDITHVGKELVELLYDEITQ